MKVNGYQIRDSLRRIDLLRKTLSAQFDDCLFVFPGEEKPTPETIATSFVNADRDYAALQTFQQQYNSSVFIEVAGESMSLACAVKVIGGAGRLEKMWRDASAAKKDRYASARDGRERHKDTEYANRAVPISKALAYADKASRYASELRTAIARANNTEIEMPDEIEDVLL